jgi:hypothetical protein
LSTGTGSSIGAIPECRPERTVAGALPSGSTTSAVVFGRTLTSRANAFDGL